MERVELKDVTLICVDCYSYGKAINALQKSLEQIKPSRAIFLTDIPIELDGIEVVQIESIKSKKAYSDFIVKQLYLYFDTLHCLIIQHDGYVLNGDCWDSSFLNFDYIGAAWLYTDGRNVGNGGFSMRSKKLQTILGTDETISVCHHEDDSICRLYRPYLEKTYGIKYADEQVADKFSFELREPISRTFGFHGYFHKPYKPTVILKRSAALGDIISLEPIMRYYYMKGYSIVLDVPESFFEIFLWHYFPIKHISKFDRGRITPEKEIDFDLAYEIKPRQNHIKSYFEIAGIYDYELSNPQLLQHNDQPNFFNKYVCVHIDERETPDRNIYNIDWKKVEKHLHSMGYFVLQIGKNKHEKIGQEINTASVGVLKFIISGCDFFIGVDSGPAHIAMAYNKPCILFFGSVNPDYIYTDTSNAIILQGNCDNSYCWHSENGGTSGVPCKYEGTKQHLQCCSTNTWEDVVDAINEFHK